MPFFTIRQLAEKKQLKTTKELYIAFVDQEKAFDKVDRQQFWKILSKYGVPQHLINLCRSSYTGSQYAVKTSVGLSDKFHIHSSVRQGCVLSPLLFITYIDCICKIANTNEEDNLLSQLLFADYQAIISTTKEQLQQLIKRFHTI